jgi:hypothetical protein
MTRAIWNWASQQSLKKLTVLTLLALAFHMFASSILNKSYEASQFPVQYYVAQLSFSPESLRQWYGQLIEKGTLDIYIQTQHIDFLFIASVLVLHPLALLLIAKLFANDSIWQKIMIGSAALSALAPLADALENWVSYVMLAQPADFAPWLAYLYSGVASLKFAMFVFAYVMACMGILIAAFQCFHRKLQVRKSA